MGCKPLPEPVMARFGSQSVLLFLLGSQTRNEWVAWCIIWQSMSPKEKKRFDEMAEKDKARYSLEMKDYVPPKDEAKKRKKRVKDPNAPKRAL